MGHVAFKCISERVYLITEEDQPSNKFKVELLRILKKSITFTKLVVKQDLYDILKDLWLTSVNVIYG